VTLRIYEPRDAEGVLDLANRYAAFDGTTSMADLEVAGYFPRGAWVAEEGGEIVGFAYGYFKDVPPSVLERWHATKVAEIALLVVEKSHRKHGIGTSLITRLCDEFKKAGADMVTLACPAASEDAKSLYDGQGFWVRSYLMAKSLGRD